MTTSLLKSKPKNKTALRKVTDSTFDCIYKFYFDKRGCRLSDHQEQIRARWEMAYALLCDFKTRRQAAKILSKHNDLDDRTCYQDINNAMRLFGDPQIGLKSAKRAIANEWILKGIDRAFHLDDMVAYDRLIMRYAKINGLDADMDNPISDILTKLKPTTIIFSTDKSALEKEAEDLMIGSDNTEYATVISEDED